MAVPGSSGLRSRVGAGGTGRAGDDALGNVTHSFNVDGPIVSLVISVEGELETQDTAGVVRGTVEPFPPGLFLRQTDLTQADEAIRDLGTAAWSEAGGEVLGFLHALGGRLHRGMRFEIGATDAATKACDEQRIKDSGRTAAGQRPSMGQDMQKGRRTEIEFLNGLVAREGERLGVPCKANATLTDIVKRVERGVLNPDPKHITELRLN